MLDSSRLQAPYRIADGTWIIPQVEAIGPDQFFTVNSMVITAGEPVIVDTGTFVNRAQWLDDTFAIVDPADVRWVFLTHGDRDHIGNVDAVLDLCPKATVLTTMWGVRYMLGDSEPRLDRMRWVNDGETFEAGDRRLVALRPPVWDGANTRGLFDPTTGVRLATTLASAHGPVITGSSVSEAYGMIHDLPRMDAVAPSSQSELEQMVRALADAA